MRRVTTTKSIFRCTSGFAGYKKRLECDLREGEQEGVRSDSNATERASLRERFDKRARVVWLTLMGHEDDLSRKITVKTVYYD